MESVLRQTCPVVEYIVIDGGSTDGTLDVIRQFDEDIDYWVSEPDRGISDAFNKGISLCSGEWIGLLNAGDWYEIDAVERMASAIVPDVDFMFAACAYHRKSGPPNLHQPDSRYEWKLPFFMPQIHHPSVFVRRSVYERYGGFDVGMKCAMDYEFLLRIHKAGCRGRAVDAHTVNMMADGVSVRDYPLAREEVRIASIRYGLPGFLATGIKACFMSLNQMRWGIRQ
jgi:glycosyltransferase involved in cell wall biosynthesis